MVNLVDPKKTLSDLIKFNWPYHDFIPLFTIDWYDEKAANYQICISKIITPAKWLGLAASIFQKRYDGRYAIDVWSKGDQDKRRLMELEVERILNEWTRDPNIGANKYGSYDFISKTDGRYGIRKDVAIPSNSVIRKIFVYAFKQTTTDPVFDFEIRDSSGVEKWSKRNQVVKEGWNCQPVNLSVTAGTYQIICRCTVTWTSLAACKGSASGSNYKLESDLTTWTATSDSYMIFVSCDPSDAITLEIVDTSSWRDLDEPLVSPKIYRSQLEASTLYIIPWTTRA